MDTKNLGDAKLPELSGKSLVKRLHLERRVCLDDTTEQYIFGESPVCPLDSAS